MTQAIILAGGQGRRLYPLTKKQPKPMIKIEGKPVLTYLLELLKKYKIREVVITLNYLPESITEYYKTGSDFGIKIRYIIEEKPFGTAGALSLIKITEPIIVLYGDILVNMNLKKLINFHRGKKSQATLVVHHSDHFQDSDVINLDEKGRVLKIIHRPKTQEHGTLTNAGLYLLEPECINEIPKNNFFDFTKDLFPMLLNKRYRMYGYNTNEYLRDMGTLNRYKRVCEDVKNGEFARSRLY